MPMERPMPMEQPTMMEQPVMMEQLITREPLRSLKRSRKNTMEPPILKKTRTREYTKQTNRTTRKIYNVFSRFNENPVIRSLEPRSANNLISNPLSRTFTRNFISSPNRSPMYNRSPIYNFSPISHLSNSNGEQSGRMINVPNNEGESTRKSSLNITGSSNSSHRSISTSNPTNITQDPIN